MSENPLSVRERWIILGLTLLTIIAHFVNLGLMPLNADEALRASVAFEMMERENYIVPTIWGEFYYRKPPFYNWVIIGFFQVFGSFSEFVFRLPSVIPLMLFGVTIWRIARKRIGERAALLAAFGFILNGSLLTRDSMLGHIDILYSWFTFLGFYSVYCYWKRGSYYALFLVSYFIASIGVLMKGLPSFLFQGLTILAWLAYQRQWRMLFSLQHLTGILVFASVVGGYFYAYSEFNSLEDYFFQLYDQSSQRTVIDRKWYEGLLNLFVFPFKNLMQLFPTALFLLFMFRRGTIKRWIKNDFTAFALVVLAANIIPYWLSPGYHTRYLFMLYPLLYILGSEAFFASTEKYPKLTQWMYGVFLVGIGLLILAFGGTLFVEEVRNLPLAIPAAIVLLLASVALMVLWFRMPKFRLYWSLMVMVLLRFGFDFFVVPHRVYVEDSAHVNRKMHSEKIVEITGDTPLWLHRNTPAFTEYAYYLGVGKDTVIGVQDSLQPGVFYLTMPRVKAHYEVDEFYRFDLEFKDYELILVKLKE